RNPQAEVRIVDLSYDQSDTHFAIEITKRAAGERHRIDRLHLPMPGEHNILNAAAAIAVAHRLGVEDDQIRGALNAFSGVKRRFTKTGEWNGVPVFDDYGHHPVEISAVLKAAREVTSQRVVAVMQPHRYTRLADLFDDFCSCFNDADTVIIAPVYTAGEDPIDGANHTALVEGLVARGHRDARALKQPEDLAGIIAEAAAPGDLVICLGAGSITHWAHALPGELAAISGKA
ncbi:MAG: cyanophycin synthetase, partial [Pseudomonadota bacterium]